MNSDEIKKILINSLNSDPDAEATKLTEDEVIAFDFRPGFKEKVLNKIFSVEMIVAREVEFSKYMKLAFSRIALTGIAAIVLLLLSIFFMEGSISFNSILGLSNTNDESIVCLLTGN
jgi:hypothetical protein